MLFSHVSVILKARYRQRTNQEFIWSSIPFVKVASQASLWSSLFKCCGWPILYLEYLVFRGYNLWTWLFHLATRSHQYQRSLCSVSLFSPDATYVHRVHLHSWFQSENTEECLGILWISQQTCLAMNLPYLTFMPRLCADRGYVWIASGSLNTKFGQKSSGSWSAESRVLTQLASLESNYIPSWWRQNNTLNICIAQGRRERVGFSPLFCSPSHLHPYIHWFLANLESSKVFIVKNQKNMMTSWSVENQLLILLPPPKKKSFLYTKQSFPDPSSAGNRLLMAVSTEQPVVN